MHTDITLSIIVPHYNVEQYIDCLYTSLFPQIGEKTELILLEDCSPDIRTKTKMQAWEKRTENPHIKFVYQEKNLGLSGTRNHGVSIASGEYVWFIDSDDTITDNAVEHILSVIEQKQTDALVFDFFWPHGRLDNCDDHTQDTPLQLNRSRRRSLIPDKVNTEKLLWALFHDTQMYVWCYIIKKDLWQKYPFPTGRNFEDIAVMPKIMHEVETLYYLPEPLLYYRQRENSILSNPTVKSCLQMTQSMGEISNYFSHVTLSDEEETALYTFYLKMLRWSYEDLIKHHLLTKEVLLQYNRQEQYFLDQLPWGKEYFIYNMKMKKVFKLTSLLFFKNKKIYMNTKKMMKFIKSR